jgi:hypothetical protein
LRRNLIRLNKPDVPILKIADQFLIPFPAHVIRPDHLLMVDISKILHPVHRFEVIVGVSNQSKLKSGQRFERGLDTLATGARE